MTESKRPAPLVLRFGALGDTVLLTAMLRDLADRWGAPCDVVTGAGPQRRVLAGLPFVGNVLTLPSRRWPISRRRRSGDSSDGSRDGGPRRCGCSIAGRRPSGWFGARGSRPSTSPAPSGSTAPAGAPPRFPAALGGGASSGLARSRTGAARPPPGPVRSPRARRGPCRVRGLASRSRTPRTSAGSRAELQPARDPGTVAGREVGGDDPGDPRRAWRCARAAARSAVGSRAGRADPPALRRPARRERRRGAEPRPAVRAALAGGLLHQRRHRTGPRRGGGRMSRRRHPGGRRSAAQRPRGRPGRVRIAVGAPETDWPDDPHAWTRWHRMERVPVRAVLDAWRESLIGWRDPRKGPPCATSRSRTS